jgi:hypothetical protein
MGLIHNAEGVAVEIRIGIVQSMKEMELDLADDADRDTITAQVEAALSSDQVLWLTDRKGRKVGIPASRVAYVDFGAPNNERRVGFGAN